ncbi:phosphatase PAP2 family protein [Marinifilum sp.]|uniref:phosphatase PAP2 family protein n=1 Tax=Marinifilum sp. TaxID=2033137 RepID=UPI003BAC4994
MKLRHSNPHIQYAIQLFAGFLVVGAILLALYSKTEFSILVNQYSSSFTDPIFNGITQLGLGGLLAVLAVVLLFIRYYYAILCTGILAVSGIVTFIFKRVLFSDAMRPLYYLGDLQLRFPAGMEEHFKRSFPSGHTMTIFAAAFILFWVYRNSRVATINFTIAVLVGFSRIYLFQHFLVDVYVGAILGVAESVLVVLIFEKVFKLHKVPALSGSLLSKKRIPQLAFKKNRLANKNQSPQSA